LLLQFGSGARDAERELVHWRVRESRELPSSLGEWSALGSSVLMQGTGV
jgi:hypothetical protein